MPTLTPTQTTAILAGRDTTSPGMSCKPTNGRLPSLRTPPRSPRLVGSASMSDRWFPLRSLWLRPNWKDRCLQRSPCALALGGLSHEVDYRLFPGPGSAFSSLEITTHGILITRVLTCVWHSFCWVYRAYRERTGGFPPPLRIAEGRRFPHGAGAASTLRLGGRELRGKKLAVPYRKVQER